MVGLLLAVDPVVEPSSTGLSSRVAAVLAYSGWWVTGALFLFLERRDPFARRHAAQSVLAFGVISIAIVACAGLAIVSLSFFPSLFTFFIMSAAAASIAGLLLWGFALWTVAGGGDWTVPVARSWVGRFGGASLAAGPGSSD